MSSLKIAFNWTCSRILHYGNRNNNNDDDDDDDDDLGKEGAPLTYCTRKLLTDSEGMLARSAPFC